MHASNFQNANETYKDKKVVVVGTGSSGHDIAATCHRFGAKVTIIQRSPAFVVSMETAHDGLRKRWNKDTVRLIFFSSFQVEV